MGWAAMRSLTPAIFLDWVLPPIDPGSWMEYEPPCSFYQYIRKISRQSCIVPGIFPISLRLKMNRNNKDKDQDWQ